MLKKKPALTFLIICFVGLLVGEIVHIENKIFATKKFARHHVNKCKKILKGQLAGEKDKNNASFNFPNELADIPFADNSFVLGVKNVSVRNMYAPYNPSIIESDNRYLLLFRYDTVLQMFLNYFETHIGCAELNSNLEQTEKEFRTISTESNYSEDPRILKINNKLCLVYNELKKKGFYCRTMHIADLDLDNARVRNVKNLDLNWKRVEKNWVPFEYNGELHFEYQISGPRTLLKLLDNQETKKLETLLPNNEQLEWKAKWGDLRGGTPARLIGDEYLAFFHSSFQTKGGPCWYVFGAYTFENKPPFKITKISPHPILFKGIYNTPALNTAQPGKFVIFPGGYAIEEKEEKTLLHLACGENDSTIKIITLDKDLLLQSLKSVDE